MKSIKNLFMTMAVAMVSVGAFAQQNYGTLLSGNFQPTKTFAKLTTTSVDATTGKYDFKLEAFDLDNIFSKGSFIGVLAVDVGDVELPKKFVGPEISNITGGSSVSAMKGSGPGGIWEFRFDFGDGKNDRLIANETVSWTATFNTAYSIAGIAMHVQGIDTSVDRDGSAWYTPTTAVPEPETYAMMLAGLGLMGTIARRRKAKSA